MTYNIVNQLNGNIFNLKGNHDRRTSKWFDDIGVTLIKESFIVDCSEHNMRFYFSHKPHSDIPPRTISIHGHTHNNGA